MSYSQIAVVLSFALAASGISTGHAQDGAAPARVGGAGACSIAPARDIPGEVRETSGLAASLRHPGRFWTHNDAGNQPMLFALDSLGGISSRVRVRGAELVDWEDIAIAPCGRGHCLYVGDIGDNGGKRAEITVYEVPEPVDGASEATAASVFRARYPGKAQDSEAIFALAGRLYLVTKGRHGTIDLYRFPSGADGKTVELEHIRTLWPKPGDSQDRVTSATTSPDGRWVGIRTYRTLHLFPADRLVSGREVAAREIDLGPLREAKGEGIAIASTGVIWTTSEAAGKAAPSLTRMDCRLGKGEG